MTRHIEACLRRVNKPQPGNSKGKPTGPGFYHMRVRGYGLPGHWYWMHLQVRRDATLRDLDRFLRDTWLDCCGHLSAFTVSGRDYLSSTTGSPGRRGMNVQLRSLLSPGMEFIHEYDFGTPTLLELKAVSLYDVGLDETGSPVRILARNDPPRILCSSCGEEATKICQYCIYEGKGWLCESCAESHECGEEALLPVVNSPRVGQCAYEG